MWFLSPSSIVTAWDPLRAALCGRFATTMAWSSNTSPNAITTAAVFAAVCEGYLGMMPHWDLWLHLY